MAFWGSDRIVPASPSASNSNAWHAWRDQVVPGMKVAYDGRNYIVQERIDIVVGGRESLRRLNLLYMGKEIWGLDICTSKRGDIELFFWEMVATSKVQPFPPNPQDHVVRYKRQPFKRFHKSDYVNCSQISSKGAANRGRYSYEEYEASDRSQLWIQQYEGSETWATIRRPVGLYQVQIYK